MLFLNTSAATVKVSHLVDTFSLRNRKKAFWLFYHHHHHNVYEVRWHCSLHLHLRWKGISLYTKILLPLLPCSTNIIISVLYICKQTCLCFTMSYYYVFFIWSNKTLLQTVSSFLACISASQWHYKVCFGSDAHRVVHGKINACYQTWWPLLLPPSHVQCE